MTRNKIPQENKKVKLNATIDPEISRLFDIYLKENNIYNKSQYIENFIKDILIKNNKL